MARKVLIVDDEPNIVTSLEFLMRRCGYEVAVARNGEEALGLVASFLPDLVLLDVMMPIKSGYDVCRAMRENPAWRHVKIVVLSAKGREAEVSKGLSLGADAYVTKPFSSRELTRQVGELLGEGDTPRSV
jgi:two-component system, OmpR family, alkaline phosphatase synthesis response regulator PhoP